MTRIHSWFSCGAASAIATKLAIAQYPGQVTPVRIIVKDEHEDNDRFARDCEAWFGVPIVNMISEEYDGSVDEVIRRQQYISGIHGAPCTRLLKKQVREAQQRPTDKHIFGYTHDPKDMDRWNDFLDANNIDVEAPLIERKITHANCLAMVEAAGIELPVMYKLGFQHNNCIGCVKSSGAGYWNKIRTHFPLVFKKRCEQSRALGVRMIEVYDNGRIRIFLDELKPNTGRYKDEPEIQCGAFCEAGIKEYSK